MNSPFWDDESMPFLDDVAREVRLDQANCPGGASHGRPAQGARCAVRGIMYIYIIILYIYIICIYIYIYYMYIYIYILLYIYIYIMYIYIPIEDPEAETNASDSNTRVRNFRLRSEFMTLKNEK